MFNSFPSHIFTFNTLEVSFNFSSQISKILLQLAMTQKCIFLTKNRASWAILGLCFCGLKSSTRLRIIFGLRTGNIRYVQHQNPSQMLKRKLLNVHFLIYFFIKIFEVTTILKIVPFLLNQYRHLLPVLAPLLPSVNTTRAVT